MADQNHAENNKAVANLLLKKGLATKEQIQKAIAHQKNSDKNPSLLRVLVGMKILDKETAQKIQASMNKPKSEAKEKPVETAQSNGGGFSFVDDDSEVIAREKKAGNLGVQMFDGNADISGIDLAEDDSDKIMKKKADYFEPVEAVAKKQNQKGQAQAKKKKKPVNPDDLKCQNCGSKVKENQRRCRECGMPLDLDELRSRPQDLSKKNWKMYAIPAVVLVLVIIGIVFFMGEKEKSDNERKKLTAEEQATENKRKLEKRAGVFRDRVSELEKIKDIKEQEEQALHYKKSIDEFCEENDYPKSRFAAQYKIIENILEKAEEERERLKKEHDAVYDDDEEDDDGDDDDGEVVENDDDDEVVDENKPRALNDRELKKFEKFNAALKILFETYDPKWEKPTSEFKDAVKDLDRNSFDFPVLKMMNMIIDGEEPITELPAVTSEDGIIYAQTEPWGICLTVMIKNLKSFKSKKQRDKVFEVFQKYISRYPVEVIAGLKNIGEEYALQLQEFLFGESDVDNENFAIKVNSAKTVMINLLTNSKKKEYYDKIAEVCKKLLKNTNNDWAKKALYWIMKKRPDYCIDDVTEWLKSEDNNKSGYARKQIEMYSDNDNADPAIKNKYAEKIIELSNEQDLPDTNNIKVILKLDREKGIAWFVELMKKQAIVNDVNYFNSLRAVIESALRDGILKYYPTLIENMEIKTEFRAFLLDNLIKHEKDKHFSEIMDLIFKLLANENDVLNPLEIAIKMLKEEAEKGKINMKDYWSKFKVYYDNHKRKDGYELFLAMYICDKTKALDVAMEYINDDKGDDRNRSLILKWYSDSEETNDTQVLEVTDKIERGTIKPGAKTIAVIETIKVDVLFKKCDNKDFQLEGSRLNQAAIGTPYNTLMAIDANGKSIGLAGQSGLSFRVYDLRSGGKKEVDRKKVSEAFPEYRKAKEKWDAMKDKGDNPKPLSPPGEECNYKEQLINISVASGRVRLLTAAGNVEYWTLDEKPLRPEIEESEKSPYCTNIVKLSDKIEELKGLTISTEMITSSGDGNIVAIQIAGYQVLVIEIEKRKLISKVSPGTFTKMKLDNEGDYILFYGGETMKTRIHRTDRPESKVIIDVAMEKEDYAGFGAESKTVLVSSDNKLLRFDVDSGEKKGVHIVPSLKIDDKFFTFIAGKGRYLGEFRDGRIRLRKIDKGKMEEATGYINDASHISGESVVVSENGKFVAFLMKDGSIMIFKIG